MKSQQALHTFPTIKKSTVTLSRCVEVAGDLVVGTLLQKIGYWSAPDKLGQSKLRVKKLGHFWIAKDRQEWLEETRLTADQYRRAVKVLREKKLIEVRQLPFGGRNISHIRLLVEVQFLQLQAQPLTLEKGIIPHSTEGQNPSLCTTITTDNDYGQVLAKNAEQEQTDGTDGKNTGTKQIGDHGKIGVGSGESESEQGAVVKADEILQKVKTGHRIPKTVEGAWKSKLSVVYPKKGDLHPLTQKERGQLKQLKTYLGDKTIPVIDYVINHWISFGTEAAAVAGTGMYPAEPHTGFLLKYCEVAVKLLEGPPQSPPVATSLLQSIAPTSAMESPPPASRSELDDKPYHPTKEELAKMIAALKE